MRTLREVLRELDAVNGEIEAIDEYDDPSWMNVLDSRRKRLEAELVEIRQAEADRDLRNAKTTAQCMDRIMAQGFPSLFGGGS